MAIKNDWPGIGNKTSNEGSTDAGRLTHDEWNALIDAVDTVQTKVENTTNIKGILYKGKDVFNTINNDGYLEFSPADPLGDVITEVTTQPPAYIASDSDCKVTFRVYSTIPSTTGQGSMSSPLPCKVKFYIDNGTGKSELVGEDSIYDWNYAVQGVKKEITFDFAAQKISLAKGENIENKLTIEVDNDYGKIVPTHLVVRVIDLSMTVENFPTKKVYTFNDKPQIKVNVFGSNALVFANVDNKEVLVAGEAKKDVMTSFSVDLFDQKNVNTHGVHTIKLWAKVLKDNPTDPEHPIEISTKPLEYNYIYGTISANPIVMANITNKTPEQYTVFNIDYIAYKYSSSNAAVTDNVKTGIYEILGTNDDGSLQLGRELTASEQMLSFDSVSNSASGRASLSLFPVNIKINPDDPNSKYEEVVLIGDMAVVITIGDYQYVDSINITPSSIQLQEVPQYAVRLSSSGRSNDEGDDTKRIWESVGSDTEGNPIITNVTFDANVEFADTGSGWIYDGDKYDPNDSTDKGNVAMRLRKGRYFTLNYNPFKINPTYMSDGNSGTGDGMTISIEFATRNALNQEASVISCLSNDSLGNPRGFEILANKATIYSKSNTLYADFKEDTRIRLDFVIDGKQWPYSYDTVWTEENDKGEAGKGETVSKKDTDYEALAIIYVDGVYQALAIIPEGDSYMQSNGGVPIRFGSEECDLDIYNVRIYNQALSPIQIVQNYAYDTPNVKNKLAIAERNQNVLTVNPNLPHKPNINIEGLRKARPALPFFYVEMDAEADPTEELPKDKKKWKLMKMTQYKNPKNSNSQLNGNASFEIEYGVMRNQGTSSMTYPWPWRNWDWKTGDDTFPQGKKYYYIPTIDDPQAIKTKYWAQYKGMQNISPSNDKGNIRKITLKKDYASSEMCNNAITSEMFTDMALGLATSIPGVLSPAQRATGGRTSPYRLTFVAQPCFMFRKYSDSTKVGSAGAGYEALGMMNLIPNKNECAYLGFFDKWQWDPEKDMRAQSWELSDNYPEYFWKQEIKTLEKLDGDGNYKNHIDGYYEARYPKDTTVFFAPNEITGEIEANGDFGMVTPDTVTDDELLAVQDEQKDLVEFHNWLVSTNRQIPLEYKKEHGSYRPLEPEELVQSWNQSEGKPKYTQDTPEYRLAKFKAEGEDRMLVDQFALYYVWREMFWAYDSGLKNLQIYTMGVSPRITDPDINTPMQWGCMVRDADTTLGIQNQGRIEFLPYLEDVDYYTEVDGKKVWHFDALPDVWDEEVINDLKGKHILNGQLATLWINLRDAFGDRIRRVYQALKTNSDTTYWTAGKAIKRFRDHQEKWCESLYNWGMRQYFGGSPFTKWINSGLGDKKNSRASWLQQAFNYRDAKYKCLSDYAALRCGCYKTPDFDEGNTSNQTLQFKLYQPTYLCLGADEINCDKVKVHRRVADVSDYVSLNPINDLQFAPGFTSAMNVMFGTNNMVEIGDFARVCKIFEIQYWQFPKLKKLLLGHEPERDGVTYMEYDAENNPVPISNVNLSSIDLSTLKQLQVLDVTNHTKLGNFNASYCTELKELYAAGCNSTKSIVLPQTATLETIYFPSSITDIKLEKLSGIKKFKLATPDAGVSYALSNLVIDNCGDYMAAESYNLVKQVISTLEKVYHPTDRNNICTLYGINWQDCKVEYLERLLNINAKLTGYINLTDSLNNDLKVKLVNAYGPIDNPNNGLHIEYRQVPISSISMPSKIYLHAKELKPGEGIKPYDTQLTFNYTLATANTYSHAEWTLSGAGSYATIDKATGVITRSALVADESTPAAELTLKVYQIPDSNTGIARPTLELTKPVEVYFYERHARPGDIVYHDGTFTDEIDKTKTAVGVCFYVDPTDKKRRLMVALENISESSTGAEPNKYSWGIGDGQAYTGGIYQGSPVLSNPEQYGISSMSEIRDLKHISNITEHGGDVTNQQMLNDEVYRSISAKNNDYFFPFQPGTRMGYLGWGQASYDIELFDKDAGAYKKVIKKDEYYPRGYIATMAMIEKRDWAVTNFNGLNITGTSSDFSELYNLYNDLRAAENAQIEGWSRNSNTYLFPAASLAYAYEPGGEGSIPDLHENFKKHNWFLPASGDAVRICYYMRQYFAKDSEFEGADAFAMAIDEKKLKTRGFLDAATNGASGMTILTSTESAAIDGGSAIGSKYVGVIATGLSSSTAIGSNVTYNGICVTVEKYTQNSVRPICRF